MPENADKSVIVDRSIASVKEAGKIAAANNVVMVLEIVNRFEQFIMNSCVEALDFVKRVDSPNVKSCWTPSI